jgi:hypothetical protein
VQLFGFLTNYVIVEFRSNPRRALPGGANGLDLKHYASRVPARDCIFGFLHMAAAPGPRFSAGSAGSMTLRARGAMLPWRPPRQPG